jgi:hypothetical protein
VAIKALTGVAHDHGAVAVLSSPWLPAAGAATVAAFFAFQRGLQIGTPVPVISLMTAGTTAVSVAGGFVVFGDPLGTSPALVALHIVAFALVAVAAAALAPAAAATPAESRQRALSLDGEGGVRSRPRRTRRSDGVRKAQEGEGPGPGGDGLEGHWAGPERAGHGNDDERQPARPDDLPHRADRRQRGVRG